MHLTFPRLARLYPDAPNAHLAALANLSAELLGRYGIDRSPCRLTFFLAMIGHHSAGLPRGNASVPSSRTRSKLGKPSSARPRSAASQTSAPAAPAAIAFGNATTRSKRQT